MNWRKPTHPTIPPPCRAVARNVSTDEGMYRKKACAPPCPTQHDPAIKVGTQRVAWEIVWDCGSSPQGHKRIEPTVSRKGGKVVKVKDAPRRGNEPTAQGRVECNGTAPWDQRNDTQSC